MQPRFCYAVRFDGDWSPSLAVWATDSKSAIRIAAQTNMGQPTGAVEMFTPAAYEYTFGGLPGWEDVERLPVLYGLAMGSTIGIGASSTRCLQQEPFKTPDNA